MSNQKQHILDTAEVALLIRSVATPGEWKSEDTEEDAILSGHKWIGGPIPNAANRKFIIFCSTEVERLAKAVAIMYKAMKQECACPGETNWTTNLPILCDLCEAREKVDKL